MCQNLPLVLSIFILNVIILPRNIIGENLQIQVTGKKINNELLIDTEK